MDKRTLVAIFAGLAVICVTALGIAFIVSGGTDDAPAPAASTPAPEPSTPEPTTEINEFVAGVLEDVWDSQSYSDQQSLCFLFNTDSDQAWEAFDTPQNEYLTKDQFLLFFSEKCVSA